ncbi:MAG: hypothetical protein IJ795_02890 [Bacteroidales bacterium]|nr:hypothetical protein [Bacteroidales bacterium]
MNFAVFNFIASLPLGEQLLRLLFKRDYASLSTSAFGIDLPHPVGLASGFDVKGSMFNALMNGGFSFVQSGPFSDKKQVLKAISHLTSKPHDGTIALHFGLKDVAIPWVDSVKFYETAFSLTYDFADIFVFSTGADYEIDKVLDQRLLMEIYKPVLLSTKGKTDLDELKDIIHYALMSGIDGIVVGTGSFEDTLRLTRFVVEKSAGKMPVVASGGIYSPEQAQQLLSEGATLLEIGEGLMQHGPFFTRKVLKYLNLHK